MPKNLWFFVQKAKNRYGMCTKSEAFWHAENLKDFRANSRNGFWIASCRIKKFGSGFTAGTQSLLIGENQI